MYVVINSRVAIYVNLSPVSRSLAITICYSPYTVTVAGLDSILPPLLLATHLYTPSSDSIMLVILNTFESASDIIALSFIHL